MITKILEIIYICQTNKYCKNELNDTIDAHDICQHLAANDEDTRECPS